ncbi:MAG: anti-sigma factor family protein [Candidatus Kapaibacterium sp.]
MDYTKLIHEFVDGTLSPEHEEELFASLRSNDELRSELKQQMAIKSAVRSDTKAFTPSAASTMAIFGELGFTPPQSPPPAGGSSATSAGAGAASGAGIMAWLGQFSQGLIGGAIAAAATAAALLLLGPHLFRGGDDYEARYLAAREEISQMKDAIAAMKAPEVTIVRPESSAPAEKQIIYRTIYIERTAPEAAATAASDQQPVRPEFIRTGSSSPAMFAARLHDPSQTRAALATGGSSIPVGLTSDNRLWDMRTGAELGITLEAGGNSPMLFDEERAVPDYFRKLNNTGLSLMYCFSDQFKAGAEYRRENFYQKYDGRDSLGIGYSVEQQPNFDSFGFMARYSPQFVNFGVFYPFAQASVGINQAGPIGRIMLGTEIAFNPAYSFVIGGELSGLVYTHQNEIFTAGKGGLYIGASFNF